MERAASPPTLRKLPPLPPVEPLPPGPFGPFTTSSYAYHAPSPPNSQDSFPIKSTTGRWSPRVQSLSPPSSTSSDEFSPREASSTSSSLTTTTTTTTTQWFPPGWPHELTRAEIMELVAPRNITRKPPLQQLCGRKRKNDFISSDGDDQREKHRIAEGNRRKNLSQLHRELDSRVHDLFLQRAGWNPVKNLPQSKEHIVQAAIFLIDFMLVIIEHLLPPEKPAPPQLTEHLKIQLRNMHLQQQMNGLQAENENLQQQIRVLKQEYEDLLDRHREMEFRVKAYELTVRSVKAETHRAIPPPPPSSSSEDAGDETKDLPGPRVICESVAGNELEGSSSFSPIAVSATSSAASSFTGSHPSFWQSTPPATNPSSPLCPSSSLPWQSTARDDPRHVTRNLLTHS